MRTPVILVISLSFLACGGFDTGGGTSTSNVGSSSGDGTSSSSSGGTTTTATWTDAAMQSVVANRCATAGCHDGTHSPNYVGISEASMRSSSRALAAVESGSMPPRASLSASEKATFLAFYE